VTGQPDLDAVISGMRVSYDMAAGTELHITGQGVRTLLDGWDDLAARLHQAEQARDALERLVADIETNSEQGAPDYAWKALDAAREQGR